MRSVDLFRIVTGGTTWLLTSAVTEQTHNAETYTPAPIGRGGIQNKSELSKVNMEVRIALGHALATAMLSRWDEFITTMTVFSKRTSGTEVLWKGRLASLKPDDDSVRLSFESIYTSMRRPGLRARFQKSCRHALYGRGCFLDPADFAIAATIDAIDGLQLTVPEAAGEADGFYSGGMIKASDDTFSYISEHVGSSLVLNRLSSTLASDFATGGPGTSATIYPGCDHSYATCASKFSNDDNYGGFDYIPIKNPTGGSSIV